MPRWLWLALHPVEWYVGAKYRRTYGAKGFLAVRDERQEKR